MRDILRSRDTEGPVVLFINIVPLLRGDLSFIGEVPILIDHLGLNNIKYLFRVNVAAFMAFAFITVNHVYTSLEIHDRIYRITIIDLIASSVKNQKFIKHFEYVR